MKNKIIGGIIILIVFSVLYSITFLICYSGTKNIPFSHFASNILTTAPLILSCLLNFGVNKILNI